MHEVFVGYLAAHVSTKSHKSNNASFLSHLSPRAVINMKENLHYYFYAI